ncbi:hypothetical protein KA405_04340 [Patescibacteria group bacterium]|nr:hypothetical protein [Patescibacteria group bacterium]
MYTEIIEPYVTNEMPRHSIRLKEYEEVINSCLHVLRKSIDVHTIQITKTRMLTENEKKVITEILEKIDGKSLISYAMTEISDMK